MSTTNILALTAIVISVVSIISTIIFSLLQQRHNKNSIRPICDIKFNDYENKIGVYLANHGNGPLTIKHISCTNDDVSSPVLYKLMPDVKQEWTTFTEDVKGWTIPAGGKIALIELCPQTERAKIDVRASLMNMTIDVIYTDLYGKSKFKSSRNLAFFGRTLNALTPIDNKRYDNKKDMCCTSKNDSSYIQGNDSGYV